MCQSTDKHRLFEPCANKLIGERAFSYCAPRLYNKLPIVVKMSVNVITFKNKLKTFLLCRLC